MILRAFAILFLLCSSAFGQITAPATIPAGQLIPIEIEGNPPSCIVIVRALGKEAIIPTFEVVAPTKTYVFTALGPAYYMIDVITSDETGKQNHYTTKTFIQGEGEVQPPDINPNVDPVGPAPIPLAGFRVMFITESEDASDSSAVTKEQREVFYSSVIRDYLNAKCVKGPDNKTAEWRIVDPNAEYSADEQRWKDAAARKRDKLPWVIISDGKVGYEGPLPANVEDTLKLLKKYGGE